MIRRSAISPTVIFVCSCIPHDSANRARRESTRGWGSDCAGSPRIFGVNKKSLETFLTAYPDYARDARPLLEANAKAARLRKGGGADSFLAARFGCPSSRSG